ncbi:hypothetical protein [Longimicrobium sp.]|uniref:hypothetical protein n=1 Tax=Longimicrobium sp. TaxID=2029185 RepID=UPI002E35E3A0|nr:hypothetical protein [Longimicrobium sp.]
MSGTLRRLRPAAALATLVMGAAACPAGAPAPDAAVPCAPAEGELAAGARADALAGPFRLTMTATRGAQSGQSAVGTLRLEAFGGRPLPVPAAAGVRYPLFGGADVDVARVGAFAVGDVRRADPAAPGVLVMEYARGRPLRHQRRPPAAGGGCQPARAAALRRRVPRADRPLDGRGRLRGHVGERRRPAAVRRVLLRAADLALEKTNCFLTQREQRKQSTADRAVLCFFVLAPASACGNGWWMRIVQLRSRRSSATRLRL